MTFLSTYSELSSSCVTSFFMSFCLKPVDDAFAVQEHQGGSDLRRVETRSALVKLPGLLDVEHEIAAVHKLHHEEKTILQFKKNKAI